MAFPGLRVLVVDDDQSIRQLLRNVLERWSCKVEEAAEGQESIEKYRQSHPDIVLMDLEMPVMNGFDASREMMQHDPQAAILLITGFSETTLARKALEKGYVKLAIPKPFHLDQLKDAIQEAIRKPKAPSKASSGEEVVA